eukprot:gene12230-12368_t
MGKDFFDDFNTKVVVDDTCIAKLNDLLIQLTDDGRDNESAFTLYVESLQKMLSEQSTNLQAALADNPGFIYVEAAADIGRFKELMCQTATAALSASKSAAEAEVAKAQGVDAVPGTWVPPPADVHPETDLDYA